jgi:hypothetical protein
MKTIPLCVLLRDPRKVKHWTGAGQSVQVTDNGNPLWILRPAQRAEDPEARARAIDELLDEALRAPRSPISAAALLEESRR